VDLKIIIEKPNENLSRLRNKRFTVRQALDNDCSHVMLLDRNIVVQPDTIGRLFSHDKDIVTALYLMREYPHFPSVFSGIFEDDKDKIMYLDKEIKGLVPILRCGLACVLIKIEVFKRIDYPWFNRFSEWVEGRFEMYCDTDAIVGRKHTVTIWPTYNEGWNTEYRNDNGNLVTPQLLHYKGE
jgi:hypothetical protein